MLPQKTRLATRWWVFNQGHRKSSSRLYCARWTVNAWKNADSHWCEVTGVWGLEDAELRQSSGGIVCEESVRRKPQLNPKGQPRSSFYRNVLAHFAELTRWLLYCPFRLYWYRSIRTTIPHFDICNSFERTELSSVDLRTISVDSG